MNKALKKKIANYLLPFVKRHADWDPKQEFARTLRPVLQACSDGEVTKSERLFMQRVGYHYLDQNGLLDDDSSTKDNT